MRALPSPFPRRGGALILALIFMGTIAAGFATWITIIRQRSRVGELTEHQARKRIAAENAKIMARDYLLRRALAANADDDGLSSGTSGGTSWATSTQTSWNSEGFTTTPLWSGYSMDSSSKLAGLNGFSPTFDYPYSKSFTFTQNYRLLTFTSEAPAYQSDATTVRGYVRSRNLMLGGDLLILHRPTISGAAAPAVTGNVAVNGRVMHFVPEIAAASYSARSQRFTAPAAISGGTPSAVNIAPADLAGANLPWSNLPWTPVSGGNIAGANLESTASGDDWRFPDFTGQINFIDNPNNASNSFRAELIANNNTLQPTGTAATTDSRGFLMNGAGVATVTPVIDSNATDLPSVVLSNANGITELIIDGQSGSTLTSYAPFRPSMAIVYTQSSTGTNLATIRLRNQNNRRLILALKKDARAGMTPVNVIVETTGSSSTWHCLIICENVPLTFSYTNVTTFNLYGGIETNAPLVFPASPRLCEISLETDTRGLIRMSPRLAWVETFLTGKL